jgi:hypothetical protein
MAASWRPGRPYKPAKPPVYAWYDAKPSGPGPASAYKCWNQHINWQNSSISFQKTNGVPKSTTWTATTSLMETVFHNSSAESSTKLCDGLHRVVGKDADTVVTLTFEETVVQSSQVYPQVTPPACSIRDPVCQELYSVFDKSTFSFLSRTLFKFFTEASGGEMPNLEFNHMAPPCARADKCLPQSEIQHCRLKAEHATVFYWPQPTPPPGYPARDICARNPLTLAVPEPDLFDIPATATFKSLTVTSPTPLVILRNIHAEILPTEVFTSIWPQYAGVRGVPASLEALINGNYYYQQCGPVLDATMAVPPEDMSSYRSSFAPSAVYPGRGTSVLPVTLYSTTSTQYPLDFADLYPVESVPWDAIAGSVGCK